MNADERRPDEFDSRDETYETIGCAFEVHNAHGHGLKEKIYENSLVVECRLRGIPHQQQATYPVTCKDVHVGDFVPDLIADNAIIVDTKTVDRITDIERGQMQNYLGVTGFKVGLIINFKHPKLEWQRVALSR